MSTPREQTPPPLSRSVLTPLVTSVGAPIARALTGLGARVLMYHRFGTRDARRLDPDAFALHLEYLVRHFRPCSLGTLADALRDGRRPPRGAVAVTIDDGYEDFVEHAYPLLQRFEVPATVFVTTRFLDRDFWLWFDASHYLLHAARASRIDLTLAGVRVTLDLSSAAARQAAWSTFGDHCLRLSPAGQGAALTSLQQAVDVPLPSRPTSCYRAMSWDQARSLDPQLVDVGSHTCTHPVLSRCSDDEIDWEVRGAREIIAQKLGRAPDAFCYPNGQPEDYDARCLRAVEHSGYRCATVAHGTTVHAGANPYAIERLSAPPSRADFRRTVDGVTQLANQWRAW
jgi:peptidoglycan/xylan/chitin deacetylase (PgdA/CDA1 family)